MAHAVGVSRKIPDTDTPGETFDLTLISSVKRMFSSIATNAAACDYSILRYAITQQKSDLPNLRHSRLFIARHAKMLNVPFLQYYR